MDGLHRVSLDDSFLIKQALLVRTQFCCWARWARVSIEKFIYFSRYIFPREGLALPWSCA